MKLKRNQFRPVILFHEGDGGQDMTASNSNAGSTSIKYGDPLYRSILRMKKADTDRRLARNSLWWQGINQYAQQDQRDISLRSMSSSSSSVSSTPPSSPTDDNSSASFSPLSSCAGSPPSPLSLSEKHQSEFPRKHAPVSGGAGGDGRIRKPSGSSLSYRKRRGNLPKSVTTVLKQWLIEHTEHPYPTENEKNSLGDKTGLTINQISNWFINARRRILPTVVRNEHKKLRNYASVTSSSSPPSHISTLVRHNKNGFFN
ncbi:homeobox KN domain-domain-containing protein [Syncephalastrum racemosum]|uniref:Homeobox KN domain-domain-containing protein n=1 Tax=Syncephalastrum racemosum TaxID=13706 RepID=A0A1X2H1W2_SYNRA|nr:homeobox KN domain-domain-containing protein [Syncephalastrum racemosum]